jgi:hypothetical protein
MIECPVFCQPHDDIANATKDTGVAFMLTASQEKKNRLAQVLSFISQNLFFLKKKRRKAQI